MKNLKLTKLITPFGRFWLYNSIIFIILISLNFAWIVASPMSEDPINLNVYNVQTHFGCSWMFSTIKMVTNDPNLSPNPSPVTSTATTPAGAVMNPPLFLDDPIIPGINFLQNVPFLNQLPNFLPVQILTPPILGGLGNLTGLGALIPLATQLVHNVNPTLVQGAGFNAPAGLPAAFWPIQAPFIPNPVLNPDVAAGATGTASTHLPFVLLGSTLLVCLATGCWAFYKKKAALPEISETINPLNAASGTGTPLKYSLPADDHWKNFNQLYSLRADRTDKVSCLQIELAPDCSVKLFGFPVNLSMIPFLCVTSSLKETVLALFLALLRRGFIYLVRQQIAGFWKVLLFCKVKNAHLRFFAITLTKNLLKINPHSQNITIKTKIVILYTANQISRLLKKGKVFWK